MIYEENLGGQPSFDGENVFTAQPLDGWPSASRRLEAAHADIESDGFISIADHSSSSGNFLAVGILDGNLYLRDEKGFIENLLAIVKGCSFKICGSLFRKIGLIMNHPMANGDSNMATHGKLANYSPNPRLRMSSGMSTNRDEPCQ